MPSHADPPPMNQLFLRASNEWRSEPRKWPGLWQCTHSLAVLHYQLLLCELVILDIVDMQPSSKIKGGTSSSPRRSRRPPSKFDDFIPVEYKKKSKAKDNTKHQPKLPATQQQKRSQSTLKHPNPRTAYPRQLPVRNQSSTVASKGNDTMPSPKTLAKKPTSQCRFTKHQSGTFKEVHSA